MRVKTYDLLEVLDFGAATAPSSLPVSLSETNVIVESYGVILCFLVLDESCDSTSSVSN